MSEPDLRHQTVSSSEGRRARVFLAAPLMRLTGPADSVVTLASRTRLTTLRSTLLRSGAAVYSAHHSDAWTVAGRAPEPRVPSDFRAMQSADLVFAYIGAPLSAGVSLELGWASALRKPIVLLVDEAITHNPLIATIEQVSPVLPLVFDDTWSQEALHHTVETALDWAGMALSLRSGFWTAPGEQFPRPRREHTGPYGFWSPEIATG
ncbi:hypothetical protein ACFV1L_14505 [Kitasatospora sp. NPDC059646]|uniref:Nucleoside 2-deoxyribosyltransferase n=1 Tax=Kitasatospora cheerisanensis KCTC 2395 TaxID=1348663 RepID=A0A066Z1K7_9ACTN|nr:hypothetical protein [Kitasatospora cheerisanensis]KDN84065.1 hypothetical protein KCH_38560 [Kitasatospora cheerisanensis KCTC 2395]